MNNWGNQGGWDQQNNNQGGWGNQGNQGNQGWGNQGNQGWGQQQQGDNWAGNMGFISGASKWGNNLDGSQWVMEQAKRQSDLNFFDPNNNFSNQFHNMIEQQVIFVEPSPTKKLLEELKQKGQVFRDDRFPPNQNSLTGESGPQANWAKIKWDKISSANPNAKIFQGKCQPGDIKQGYLGDCYFLAALAAIAERPDRIFKLFLLTQTNAQKYYSVKILYKGKWMTIDMDEYIPYLYNQPAFTKAKQNQLWVVLLEKAWAKLYSNYKRIQAGYPEEGLHDLTGAPIRNIYLKQAGFDKQRQWNYLLTASQRQYSMVTSSQPGSDTNKSYRGVVQGHAYTLLNATYLNFQGQKIRVIQLRNPWGKGQAKGDWCDEDPRWNQVDPQQRQRLGFNLNKEDGIFFMSYDDFLQEFRAIAVAEINDEASYVYKSIKDPQNKGVFFKVQVPRPGNYSFQVDKTPQRSYPESIQQKFQYPSAKIQIGSYQNGQVIQRLEPATDSKRTTSKMYNLQQGSYIVRAQISYNKQFEKDFDVNLAVYGQYPVEIKIASKQEANALTPGTDWSGIVENSQNNSWNNMGNQEWGQNQGGNNGGWGQQGGNNGGNGNNGGWGQQQGGNNGGWGQQGGNNGGWGQQQGGNNGGWGQQQGGNNGGWGTQQQGGNNGWGNQQQGGNNGWGNQQQGGNNGWGNQQQGNNGWGNQQQGNNGWGNQQQGGNNGW